MSRKSTDPFDMTLRRQDGYVAQIVDRGDGSLEVTVTRTTDGVVWKGTRAGIEEAVLLAGRVVAEQQLVQEMRAGWTET